MLVYLRILIFQCAQVFPYHNVMSVAYKIVSLAILKTTDSDNVYAWLYLHHGPKVGVWKLRICCDVTVTALHYLKIE